MPTIANDLLSSGMPDCDWEMTVLELAIFMCIFRAPRPPRVEEICRVVGEWFECCVDPPAIRAPLALMLARKWLVEEGSAFRAAGAGRHAARPMINGMIRLLDHGTRLIDVALMMAVLRLTKGELDDAADDD